MTSDYRTAITEALALLENPEQIDQARRVLRDLLERPRQLPQAYIEDLARDDGLTAAFANAADPSAVYFRVDPESGEAGDQPVRLNHGDDLTDAELTSEQRHDLDTDPSVQDALARIQARTDGGSYLSAPSGGPSTTSYIPAGPLRPVSDAELTLLGF